jgi:hypothetical protein
MPTCTLFVKTLATTLDYILALDTLGDGTKHGKDLYLSRRPRGPGQVVMCCCRWHYHAKLCQWKHSLTILFVLYPQAIMNIGLWLCVQGSQSMKVVFPSVMFLRQKKPVTATCDSHYCTCPGNLGWHGTNRYDPICVVLPKVTKANTIVTVMCCCHWHFHAQTLPVDTSLNIANVNSA